MNVESGVLARIAASVFPENVNAIVFVHSEGSDPSEEVALWMCKSLQPLTTRSYATGSYVVEREPAGTWVILRDENLRMLYSGDAEDEMLRIVGKPPQENEKRRTKR